MATVDAAAADYERFTISVLIHKVRLTTDEPKPYKVKCVRNGKEYVTNV